MIIALRETKRTSSLQGSKATEVLWDIGGELHRLSRDFGGNMKSWPDLKAKYPFCSKDRGKERRAFELGGMDLRFQVLLWVRLHRKGRKSSCDRCACKY